MLVQAGYGASVLECSGAHRSSGPGPDFGVAVAWVRIDDGFPEHPKVGEAGPLAELLQVRALCYCNRQLTDGFVPRAAVQRMTTDFYFGETLEGERVFYDPLPGLLATGMWAECPGGYQIHDYVAFQPTKAEIEAKRDASKERKERWKNKKGTASEQRSGSVPTASESGGGTRSERDRNTTPDPNPIPTRSQEELQQQHPPSSPATDGGDASPRKREPPTATKSVIEQVREKTGRPWRSPHRHLTARLKAGATPEECILVAECKHDEWGGDEKMDQYVRQKTLYAKGNFDDYLTQALRWDESGRKPQRKGAKPIPGSSDDPFAEYRGTDQ